MAKTSAGIKKTVSGDEAILALIVDSIQDIKGKNIVQIDLRKIPDAPARYFIICEGESTTQVRAIAANVTRRMRDEAGIRSSHAEGKQGARWIAVDFFDIVLHVFEKSLRVYYDLENLWADGRVTEYQNI